MKNIILSIFAIVGILFLLSAGNTQQAKPWLAPKDSDALKNPLKNNVTATAEGKKLYVKLCVVCHGDKGKGDGTASAAIIPKPANHASLKVQSQSDGALFWKITNGRPPMASYKATLKEDQRWQLVNYIRELGKAANPAPAKK